MNPPLWLRRSILAGLLLAALAAAGGCRKAPPPIPPPAPLPADLAAARDAVLTYLAALDQKDVERAYGLLTAASHQSVTFTQFSAAAKAGKTDYAEDKTRVERIDVSHVLVTVQLFEDPAEHGFRLLLTGGAWRIEMLGGTPYAPAGQP